MPSYYPTHIKGQIYTDKGYLQKSFNLDSAREKDYIDAYIKSNMISLWEVVN